MNATASRGGQARRVGDLMWGLSRSITPEPMSLPPRHRDPRVRAGRPWPGGRTQARVGHCGRAGDVMAAKRAATGSTGKRKARLTGAGTPALDATRPPDRERRFVDVDPWAVLLEQLMVAPEEEPAGRKGGKGG